MGNCSSAARNENPDEYIDHIFNHRWKMTGVELGRGGSGTVYLARHKQRKSDTAAVKVVNKREMSIEDIDAIKHEVFLMRKLQHPNIARFIDFFDEKDHMYVVMEYLEGGCLFDRIVKKKQYTELTARDLIYIFLIALKHCHDKGVIHRDLKPENIILASLKDDTDVKIADFGLSIEDGETTKELRTGACGTPLYLAPEMIKAAAGKNGGKPYGKEIDLWAVGCLAYILLSGYPPFYMDDNDHNNKTLYKNILNGRYDMQTKQLMNVSEGAQDLIRGLLQVDPKRRLTVEQALAHPWVNAARETLAARNLHANLKTFRAFRGRPKFRAGVKALIATHRLKAVLKKLKRETLVPGSLSAAQSGEERDKGVVSESVKSGHSIASTSSGQAEHWREVNPEDVELRVTEDVESAERDEH